MSLIHPPEAVVELAQTLEAAGFETWCVGGAVRDALLGRPDLDWDLATSATPDQVRRLFRRTVPVGIKFGTIGVFDRDGRMHEVTTFRQDIETDGRHAVVKFGASLDEDLARRDLTINAIAFSPTRRVLHDPFDGQRDLARGIIRAVGNPHERMREDRLRALRAIRFAARLSFEIDPPTWSAIVESAPHLSRLSPERVRQEIEKTMDQVRRPGAAIRQWEASGALRTLVPGLVPLSQDVVDALDHLPLPGPRMRPQRRTNRIATLLLGVEPAQLSRLLRDLRFSNSDAAWIEELIRRWLNLKAVMESAFLATDPPTGAQIRRWVAIAGRTRLGPLFRIAYAVWCARVAAGRDGPAPSRVRSAYRTVLRSAYRDPTEIGDLAVDGEDLAAAGIPPGPQVGKILRALLDGVLEDPTLNVHGSLMAKARELAGHSADPSKES